MSNIMTVPEMVRGVEPECVQLIATHNDINFQAEANYAIQLLCASEFAVSIAMQNPVSVQNALRNASAIGISLNPASKHAYLVPRKTQSGMGICLDISYMGLMHLAMSTGSIEWGQAKLVYKSDDYINQGIDKAPKHEYQAFGNRGELIGAYCTVKTSTGAYLTEEMSVEQLHSVRARSEAFTGGKNKKPPSGPWVTDYEEMCRKTVVKRGSKYWPKVDRLDSAIHYLNEDGGEGISKDEPVRDVTPVNDETMIHIDELIAAKDADKAKLLEWASSKYNRQINKLSDLAQHEADALVKAMEAKR